MMRRVITILIVVLLSTIVAQGQIKIGGNVYGGGNKGYVGGSTRVTVKAGDIGAVDANAERPVENPRGRVFGGARMANVGGNTFVHIDGKSDLTGDLAAKSNYIVVNQVFGGNDIAGQIGTAAAVGENMPTELTAVKKTEADQNDPKKNAVDNTFNSYVRVSTKATDEHYTAAEIAAAESDPENVAYGKTINDIKPDPNARKVYIGQLFSGGNGDFDYVQSEPNEGKVTHTIYNRSDKNHTTPLAELETNEGEVGFHLPELDKTYMEVVGGSIVYAYGGGNNATVKEKNIIHIDNPSAVVNHIKVDANGAEDENGTDLLSTVRFKEMGINTTFSQPSSGAYQIGRFFGGNNKAEMHIRPTWNLLAGKVRNLYSGGNQGNMTSPEGLLLEIPTYSTLIVDNLYGGCRMADVMPTVNGVYTPCTNLKDKDAQGNLLYKFPNELSARTLVRGGYVHNVYGGNDVTGTVYGGNAIGIYTTVYGNVYGGGNGAYPYTDNDYSYKDDDVYGDFLYSTDGYSSPVDALNAFRPNAEQVSIRLKGTEAKPTIIKGSVFVGGNCASLATKKNNPMVELKIGSYVWADKVFLGNNGEGMINEDILKYYAGEYPGAEGFSSLSSMKTDKSLFADYMEGVVMDLQPSISFDSKANSDPDDYTDYTSKIGSFYCGGNVGSMAIAGKNTYSIDRGLVIFDKFVAGCNNADVKPGDYNPAYEGGILGAKDERGENPGEYYTENKTATGKIKDRIEVNLANLTIEPRRWNDTFTAITDADIENGKLKAGQEYYTTNLRSSRFIADGTEPASITATDKYYKLTNKGNQLEWNTALWNTDEDDFMKTETETVDDDEDRRLLGGNVYGGCYNSGHVNGNVVININQDLIKRDVVFAEADSEDPYKVKAGGERRSGVLKEAQGDDVQAVAMSVFGAGYGEETEIWGSTTVNLNNGYAFQVFGGGEEGVVGKKNAAGEYVYNAAYSSTVNMKGANAGYAEEESGLPLAESEYIYGGGSEGNVIGDTYVYLGNGRIYDAFGGASNADVYGGTEVHIGYNGGFPWVRDNIYGGNDFGGTIKGKRNHTTATSRAAFDAQMLQSATYVKYIQGRVDSIFGGCYGSYDYADPVFKAYTYSKDEAGIPSDLGPGAPRLKNGEPVFSFPNQIENSFVHFIPVDNANNKVGYIFGGSEGYPNHHRLNNAMQREAYVLIDDTKTKDVNRFANVDIYGGGAFAGVGSTETALGAGHTAVDLFAGSFHNVYGGCNQEGLVGYTRVNVPSGSTVKVNALFGGGKGYDPTLIDTKPELAARYCDNYVTCVDYQSSSAIVNDAIYGGNENSRISADTYINIEAPVMQSSGYQATIYGAGYGKKTVSGRTNVFMNNNSNAYKVFGGGRDGNAFNYASLTQWLINQYTTAGTPAGEIAGKVTAYRGILDDFSTYLDANPIHLPANVGSYVNASTGKYDGTYTNDLLPTEQTPTPTYHQTNVHITDGGNVSGYAYGGGLGTDAVVAGSTYIELKGGNVDRDIYGGGQGGPVFDEFGLGTSVFTATTNVFIEGGMARNVYGGGYLGHVGKHCKTVDGKIVEAAINETNVIDIPAVANVTIGKVDGTGFYNGIPAITRNVYGGGEGGSVYGTANLTINHGYVGYRYKNTAASGAPVYKYVEELDDQKPNAIELAGNAFGGGYVVNSYVDKTNVVMYGGTLRGSLYGGGEVGPIGRGTIRYKGTYSTGVENGDARIFKAGKTSVKMYDGHVLRNVFGGGRGKDSWGGDGTMYMDEALKPTLDLKCKGYVFGQTEVDIYGGEVGTDEGVAQGYGNVFGGGDIGCVYSAYENESGLLCVGKKNGTRYDELDNKEGYYYKYENNAFKTSGSEYILTEDCKVLVEPWCKATSDVSINSTNYAAGKYVPTSALNYLGNKTASAADWAALGKTDINKEGVIIHNAVFAGGNTSPGSTDVYANTTTVFGNATASIHDVYNRDLISIGRGRVGGLYGDGNLTLVDGYRELNITNYGTDYYHINPEITLAEYDALPKREAAYYEIRYKCVAPCTDKNGKTYAQGSTITADEMVTVFDTKTVNVLEPIVDSEGNPVLDGNGYPTYNTTDATVNMLDASGKPRSYYWVENGVCSRYAGRPMNTVQRADFCGVFGSRMVMQGAQDRVPETVDYTNYTINRVREVSLNKKVSVRPGDSSDTKNKEHGNYFGIYSVVNYLGALTSDVDFHTAKRLTDNSDTETYGPDYDLSTVNVVATQDALTYLAANPIDGVTVDDSKVTVSTLSGLASLKSVTGVTVTASRLTNQTYYDWKSLHHDERKRNNANSHNKVALASGVYLELTTEKSTGTGLREKDWGPITGVIELDLINVQPGMGGGYVYAKNEHGVRSSSGKTQMILTDLNKNNGTPAVTKKLFTYSDADASKTEWEASGNFVHSTQTIIDDCYNIGNKYTGTDAVPAHYWFIKGAVYVYDQYISAYTGNPNAFSETVNIPLTITSASHGKLSLLNVQPSRYAYYSSKNVPLGENDKIELRDVSYGRNDVINYWDWSQLTTAQKDLFVPETYVVIADCMLGDVTYKAGTVLLPGNTDGSEPGTYYYLKKNAPTKYLDEDDLELSPYVHHISRNEDVDFDFVFRSSNNVSHNKGYILTYNIDNPNQWNTWYTDVNSDSATKDQTDNGNADEDGPTYRSKSTGLFGQNEYRIGSIISAEDYTTYDAAYNLLSDSQKAALGTQATFKEAYIVTADVLETTKGSGDNAVAQRLHKGATLAKEDYTDGNWSTMSGSVAPAYVATSTVQLSKTEFIYRNTYLTADEITTIKGKVSSAIATEIDKAVKRAYYCTAAGKFGGNYYEAGHNYRGLTAFTSMSASDRDNFEYNYDALDLLIDPTYGQGEGAKYQYDGKNFTTAAQAKTNEATYSLATSIDYSATYKGSSLDYVSDEKNSNNEYITKTATNGTVLSRSEYERLPNEQYYWAPITVETAGTYYVVSKTIVLGDTPYAAGQVITAETFNGLNPSDRENVRSLTFSSTGTYYYCREGYTIKTSDYESPKTGAVTDITNSTEYTSAVPAGIIISSDNYNNLVNKQKNFSIHGMAPTETSTLFVTRGSDIYDLSSEKIITVIYQYDYVESDMLGQHITPVSERHILNIHLNFKSGVPTVEDIQQPDIILPGTTISMSEPYVTPGAYEITGGGWKLFDTESDAENHINGVDYSPSTDPLYLYQNQYYMAYYAKSYLGETYSNHVPVSVANYHDLKKVMDDKNHHYYIDHKDIFERLHVEPKIYINDYSSSSQNGLDLFKNLYDLSLLTTTPTGTLAGHSLLNTNYVGACKNLEFFLRTDINHPEAWTSIASGSDPCFEGVLHGDGHTMSGLNNSLFGKLCGEVYNLGVTGSFTGAGIAENGSGYVENTWISTSSTAAKTNGPVFGTPSRTEAEKTAKGSIQIVNSYYQEEASDVTNPYTNHSGDYGIPTRKSAQAFYNGEVAYDLNGFYLYKRYSDHQPSAGPLAYDYFEADGKGKLQKKTGTYAQNVQYCSSGYDNSVKYVEDRFADGDFRYAGGSVPETADERQYIDTEDENKVKFFPIWPDDYLFFGQKLTYGYATEAHQNMPTAVVKSDGRLSKLTNANRVYRAPAYYRSKDMSSIHFNPQVYLAQKSKDGSKEAYPNLTAIDFAGHYDTHEANGTNVTNKPYELGLNETGKFYAPLLDDGGLTGITNYDETKNLLVYAPAETSDDEYANKATYDVLTGYFQEPAYSDYYVNDKYCKVADATSATSSIYGHLVMDGKIAKSDHLLVDKEDFNCPIAYTFDNKHRMWYQRKPEDHEYVDINKGWQGISIPFTAELVTTDDKGEITHFYSGSNSIEGSEAKIGHEYWLRELNSITEDSKTEDETVKYFAKASFLYPTATGSDKTVTNTFLWDYYYENTTVHNQKDKNADKYQTYYSSSRTHTAYPLLTSGTPYIIGFPGQTYYEFDLSGNFDAKNTAVAIDKLGRQTITFASNTSIGIGVSDDETAGVEKFASGNKDYTLTFKPSYMNKSLETGTYSYTLDGDGDSYDKVPATGDAVKVTAFRPYFTATVTTHSTSPKMMPESILFGDDYSGLEGEPKTAFGGDLEISVQGHKIVATSHLAEATTVRIINVSGITIANYVIQPGETIETPVSIEGVYIANKKKLLVK